VKSKDTVEFEGFDPNWFGGTPCDASSPDTKHCIIGNGHDGMVWHYKCPAGMPCDPDVIVDDGKDGKGNPKAATAMPVSVGVAIGCDNPNDTNQTTGVDADNVLPVHYGATVGWAVVGNASTGAVSWSISFGNNDNGRQALCGMNSTTINQNNPTCVVQQQAPMTPYTAKVGQCQPSSQPTSILPIP
jgi:hypothetical protein